MHTTRALKYDVRIDGTGPDVFHLAAAEFSRPYVRDKAVLDVGCWSANYFTAIGDLSGLHVGIDISRAPLVQACGLKRATTRFIEASVLELPFSPGSFDVVCMWEVLEHLPSGSEAIALKNIRSVLRPNGYLLMSTPNSHWLTNLLDPAYWLVGHRHYPPSDLRSLLHREGLVVERMEARAGLLTIIHTIAFYVFKHIFRRRPPEWPNYRDWRVADYKRLGIVDLFVIARRMA